MLSTTSYNAAIATGRDADAEYRLIGADGITRWVHDRARCRRRADGAVEASGIVSDVTERRRMRAELAQAHAALSQAVDAMDAHLYTLRVDPDGCHAAVYRGPNREALAGGELPDGADGDRRFETLVHPEDRRRRVAALLSLAAAKPIDLEYRVIGLDGRERIVADRLRARRDPDGSLYYDGVMRDITERRRLEDELLRTLAEMQVAHRELERARAEAELRARTDELTGAFNRRHFTEIVADALRDDPHGTGLLLLDADHFKHVNDLFGHLVGDAVLVELAARLQTFLEPAEDLARWGGEEFALLLRGVRSDTEIAERAERLRSRVAGAPVVAAGISLGLTISVGAIRAGGELTDVDALVDAADRGLYAAKRGGRNRISLASHVGGSHAVQEPEAVSMARALAAAAGAREGVPKDHAGDVAALATSTAERLGLSVDVVLRCRLGGWLHDVGKVAIPTQILEKPGPLDVGRVGGHADPPGDRRGDRARRRGPQGGGRSRPPPPRALRRRRLPRRPRRHDDPDRGAHRGRRGRVLGDDRRSRLLEGAQPGRRSHRAAAQRRRAPRPGRRGGAAGGAGPRRCGGCARRLVISQAPDGGRWLEIAGQMRAFLYWAAR